MNPVPNIEACAVKLRPATVQDVGDLSRNELLDMLIRTVVVRTVAECGLYVEGTYPRADQVIRTGLGRRVGARRIVGSGLGEAIRVVEAKIAVDLVGGDVVVPNAVSANGL